MEVVFWTAIGVLVLAVMRHHRKVVLESQARLARDLQRYFPEIRVDLGDTKNPYLQRPAWRGRLIH